ncbi:chalcone--flavonone isomerase, partial [Genlisea aurea]
SDPAPPHLTAIEIEGAVFPAYLKPAASKSTFILGGAGFRGLEIEGKFIKFTAIGVYLGHDAISSLAAKWKGKTSAELAESVEFFADVVTGPFQKLTRVTMILPLTGQQYSEKVVENCTAYWKSIGKFTDAESEAANQFLQVFKNQNFPPGASIFFTQSPDGSLAISFSADEETEIEVIANKPLSEAVLDSIIGKHGVSPAAKQSLAERVAELLRQYQD